MAVTQEDMDKLREETVAKRKAIADTTATREADLKSQLSNTLSSRTTLSDRQKAALSNAQLQTLVDKTTNQRLTGSLTEGQLSGREAITPDGGTSRYSGMTQPTNQAYTPSVQGGVVGTGTVGNGVGNVQTLQERLAEAQKRATISGLDKARPSSLSALQQEEAKVQPQFAQQRSQARSTSQLGAKSFADFMAARGLQSSGGAALGETQRLGALQGTLGGLQQQEQETLANIGARRTGIEQGYQSDIASANANIEAQALQNAIDQANAQESQLRNDFQYQIVANQNNLQGFANELMAQGAPQWQIDQVLAARQQKIASLGLDQQGNALPVQQQGITLSPAQALDLWAVTGKATPEISAALGVQEGSAYSTFASRQPSSSGGYASTKTTPTKTTTTPFTGASTETVARNTTNLTNALTQARLSPQGKIDYIEANYDKLVANTNYGKEAVDKVLASLQPQEQVKKTTTSYKTDPAFADDMGQIQSASDSQKATLRSTLTANSQAFIDQYTYDGYLALLKATETD